MSRPVWKTKDELNFIAKLMAARPKAGEDYIRLVLRGQRQYDETVDTPALMAILITMTKPL